MATGESGFTERYCKKKFYAQTCPRVLDTHPGALEKLPPCRWRQLTAKCSQIHRDSKKERRLPPHKPSHQKPSFAISSPFCFRSSRASESDREKYNSQIVKPERKRRTTRGDVRDLCCHLYIFPPIRFVFRLFVCLSVYHSLIYKIYKAK